MKEPTGEILRAQQADRARAVVGRDVQIPAAAETLRDLAEAKDQVGVILVDRKADQATEMFRAQRADPARGQDGQTIQIKPTILRDPWADREAIGKTNRGLRVGLGQNRILKETETTTRPVWPVAREVIGKIVQDRKADQEQDLILEKIWITTHPDLEEVREVTGKINRDHKAGLEQDLIELDN